MMAKKAETVNEIIKKINGFLARGEEIPLRIWRNFARRSGGFNDIKNAFLIMRDSDPKAANTLNNEMIKKAKTLAEWEFIARINKPKTRRWERALNEILKIARSKNTLATWYRARAVISRGYSKRSHLYREASQSIMLLMKSSPEQSDLFGT
jgi:hypothetical protein